MRSLEETLTDSEAQRDHSVSVGDDAVEHYDVPTHEGVRVMGNETVYEMGPSFTETERPADRLTEMPAWLQTFAASEQAADDAEHLPEVDPTATPANLIETESADTDTSLPDWLRDDPVHAEQEQPVNIPGAFDDFQQDMGATDTFISEDDLPDWLRAFSHEQADGAAASAPSTPRAPVGIAAAPSTSAVRVPSVENVWLSAYDRQAIGPGRTLFALLASTGGAVEAASNGTHGSYADVPERAREANGPSGRSTAAAAPSSTEVQDQEKTLNKPKSSMRLLLLTSIVVLLLVFVSVMVLG